MLIKFKFNQIITRPSRRCKSPSISPFRKAVFNFANAEESVRILKFRRRQVQIVFEDDTNIDTEQVIVRFVNVVGVLKYTVKSISIDTNYKFFI
jgi:hypothetical protein